MKKPKVNKLFQVTIKEMGRGAEEQVYVAASDFGTAARRAVRANPRDFFRPKAVRAEVVGKVW